MKQQFLSQFWKIGFLISVGVVMTSCISATPTLQAVSSYITPIAPEAVTGNSLPTIPVSASWLTYANPIMGLSIKYPSEWKYVEQPGQMVVNFYPAGVDPQLPSGLIAFIFMPDRPYSGQPVIDTGGDIHPVIAVGSNGIQYEDSKYAVPTESYYIELSYRGGTLLIKGTKGPTENLVPQLEEMLKTLNLSSSANFPLATEAPVATDCFYALRSGDSLAGVANKFGIGGDNISDIVNFDGTPIIDANGLYEGQVVIIPNVSQDMCIQEGGTLQSSFTQTSIPTSTQTFTPVSLVGEWIIYFDWGCTGNYSYTSLFFNDNGTVTNSTYIVGSWSRQDENITLIEDKAIYSGKVIGDSIKGTMSSGIDSTNGCWNAQKNNYPNLTTTPTP